MWYGQEWEGLGRSLRHTDVRVCLTYMYGTFAFTDPDWKIDTALTEDDARNRVAAVGLEWPPENYINWLRGAE